MRLIFPWTATVLVTLTGACSSPNVASVSTDAGSAFDAGLTTDAGSAFDAGGPFTPVSNDGCTSTPDAGSGEYIACSSNTDCACPLACQTDPAALESTTATVCLQPCSVSSDCVDTTSFCQGGVCRTRQCASANGTTGQESDGGAFWAPCDADGTDDGICLPIGIADTNVVGVCQLTGSLALGASCDPLTTRDAGPGALCVPGAECLDNESVQFQTDPPFSCQLPCDPNATGQCPSGQVCILSPIAGTEDGQLRFPGGEAEFGVCSAVGANGCDEAVPAFAAQWSPCTGDADCACSQGCLSNPATQALLCASTCTTTADCPDPATTCQSGACWPTLCDSDGGAANPCDAGAAGTCLGTDSLSESLDPGASTNTPGGECIQAGTAASGASCEPNFPDRGTPGSICEAGSVCAGLPDGGGVCRDACVRGGAQAQCGTGSICTLTFYDRGSADLADVAYACFPQGTNGCVEGWGAGGTGGECQSNSDCPCPLSCNTAASDCE